MTDGATLVLFCRRPAPGSGKQRLAARLGQPRACAIAQALLECALEDAAAWPGRLVVSPAGAEDLAWAEQLIGRPKWVLPQGEGNLGRRINTVDAMVRSRGGGERVLFIGSDAPVLDGADLAAAADALEQADAALIPAADGGVVLMGSRRPWPDLTELPWSEATLAVALEKRCRRAGHDVARLAPSFDVDEVRDLVTAADALRHDRRPARRRLREQLAQALGADPPPVSGARARGAR